MCHLLFVWCAPQNTLARAESGAVFLASRWHELFDEHTPDTFHPRLFGLSNLISEAASIGHLQAENEAWGKHLHHVQEEIGERLERGFERTLCSPRHLGMVERLRKTSTASEVVGIGRVLELEGLSSSLEQRAVSAFQAVDLAAVDSRKSDSDAILTTLATHAFRKGCSSDDCREIATVVGQGVAAARTWILGSLPHQQVDFDCIVAVEAADADMESAVRTVCANANITHTSARLPGLPNEPGRIFLRRHDVGFRAVDAIDSLKSTIRASLNLLSLYKQRVAPRILAGGWIFRNDRAEPVEDGPTSFRNLHPRRRSLQLAQRAIEALSGRREEPALRAALDHHNLALSMTDHRLRLVNLWSALECLASLVDGGSIIGRVEKLTVPILTWRKIEKVVRYLALNVHYWLQCNQQIDRATCPFGLGHNDSVSAGRVLELLTEPQNSAPIVALMNLVSGHPLLLYRVNRAWQLFHDRSALHSDLLGASKRFTWHLWRIYRARNLLVHQGIEAPCLPQLANHLQLYFSWTLSRLLHGISIGSGWTARDSWHYWKSKSDHVMDSLPGTLQSLTVGDMLLEDLPNPAHALWPSAV